MKQEKVSGVMFWLCAVTAVVDSIAMCTAMAANLSPTAVSGFAVGACAMTMAAIFHYYQLPKKK